jgi:hypothetical protein
MKKSIRKLVLKIGLKEKLNEDLKEGSMKFKVIEEFSNIPVGSILSEDDNGEYLFKFKVGQAKFTKDELMDIVGSYVVEYKDNPYKMEVSENDLDNTVKKNWKVVLQVKCTEKQLLDIQRKVENEISKII